MLHACTLHVCFKLLFTYTSHTCKYAQLFELCSQFCAFYFFRPTTPQPRLPLRGSPTPISASSFRGSPSPGSAFRGTPTPASSFRGSPTPGSVVRGSPTPPGLSSSRGSSGLEAFNSLQAEAERLRPEEELFNSVFQQGQNNDNVVTRPKEDPLLRRRPQNNRTPIDPRRPQNPRRLELEQPRSQVGIKSLPPRPNEVAPRPSAPRTPAPRPTLPRDPVRLVLEQSIFCFEFGCHIDATR